MDLVIDFEPYKITSGVITQTLWRIIDMLMRVGKIQCLMTFMVLDTNNYYLLLGLDFFIKIYYYKIWVQFTNPCSLDPMNSLLPN